MVDEAGSTEVISEETYAESQGLETISDVDLQGISDDESSDDSTDETTEDKTSDDDSTEDKTSDDDSSDTDENNSEDDSTSDETEDKSGDSSTSTDSDKDDVSTSVSMVPLEALHESRNTIKFLKDQIKDLTSRAPEAKPVKNEEPEDTFKVLSESEFESLAEDNPVEAMKYNMKLMQHNALVSDKRAKEEAQEVSSELVDQVVTESLQAMEKVVPGIFDEDSSVQKELVEYAETIGFTDDMFYLTNPKTQVILPGETEPLLLGDQAVSILQVLNSSRANVAKVKEESKNNTPDEKVIEARIRKEVEAELMAKFKSNGADAFRSVKDIQKTDSKTEFGEKELTEAQFAKLSDKEQEAYLAGA